MWRHGRWRQISWSGHTPKAVSCSKLSIFLHIKYELNVPDFFVHLCSWQVPMQNIILRYFRCTCCKLKPSRKVKICVSGGQTEYASICRMAFPWIHSISIYKLWDSCYNIIPNFLRERTWFELMGHICPKHVGYCREVYGSDHRQCVTLNFAWGLATRPLWPVTLLGLATLRLRPQSQTGRNWFDNKWFSTPRSQ